MNFFKQKDVNSQVVDNKIAETKQVVIKMIEKYLSSVEECKDRIELLNLSKDEIESLLMIYINQMPFKTERGTYENIATLADLLLDKSSGIIKIQMAKKIYQSILPIADMLFDIRCPDQYHGRHKDWDRDKYERIPKLQLIVNLVTHSHNVVNNNFIDNLLLLFTKIQRQYSLQIQTDKELDYYHRIYVMHFCESWLPLAAEIVNINTPQDTLCQLMLVFKECYDYDKYWHCNFGDLLSTTKKSLEKLITLIAQKCNYEECLESENRCASIIQHWKDEGIYEIFSEQKQGRNIINQFLSRYFIKTGQCDKFKIETLPAEEINRLLRAMLNNKDVEPEDKLQKGFKMLGLKHPMNPEILNEFIKFLFDYYHGTKKNPEGKIIQIAQDFSLPLNTIEQIFNVSFVEGWYIDANISAQLINRTITNEQKNIIINRSIEKGGFKQGKKVAEYFQMALDKSQLLLALDVDMAQGNTLAIEKVTEILKIKLTGIQIDTAVKQLLGRDKRYCYEDIFEIISLGVPMEETLNYVLNELLTSNSSFQDRKKYIEQIIQLRGTPLTIDEIAKL